MKRQLPLQEFLLHFGLQFLVNDLPQPKPPLQHTRGRVGKREKERAERERGVVEGGGGGGEGGVGLFVLLKVLRKGAR